MVFVSTLCLLQRSAAQGASPESTPPAKVIVPLKNEPSLNRTELAKRPEGTIRVLVYGQVKQPNVYFMPPAATVHDAIEDAGGLTEFATWNMSYVLHPIDNERAEKIKFTLKKKSSDLEMLLKEGDRVYLGELVD